MKFESRIKLLEFQKEFKELLIKYDLNISGDCNDSGDMVIEFYDKEADWNYQLDMLSDSYDMYENIYSDDRDISVNLMDSFILSLFPDTNDTDYWKDSRTLIFSHNRDRVVDYMNKFSDFEFKRVGKENVEFKLNNGMTYKWIQPYQGAKGYRCRYAIIDRDLDLFNNHDLRHLIMHVCLYVSKETLEII